MNIHILNGPNLNLLGKREPELYGTIPFDSFLKQTLMPAFPTINITFFQSNVEGDIINSIQENGFSVNGLVINPAGFSHTSVAIADALAAVPCKKVEVHLTNLYARQEEIRYRSLTAAYCNGFISGLGLDGYFLAVRWLCGNLTNS